MCIIADIQCRVKETKNHVRQGTGSFVCATTALQKRYQRKLCASHQSISVYTVRATQHTKRRHMHTIHHIY